MENQYASEITATRILFWGCIAVGIGSVMYIFFSSVVLMNNTLGF